MLKVTNISKVLSKYWLNLKIMKVYTFNICDVTLICSSLKKKFHKYRLAPWRWFFISWDAYLAHGSEILNAAEKYVLKKKGICSMMKMFYSALREVHSISLTFINDD